MADSITKWYMRPSIAAALRGKHKISPVCADNGASTGHYAFKKTKAYRYVVAAWELARDDVDAATAGKSDDWLRVNEAFGRYATPEMLIAAAQDAMPPAWVGTRPAQNAIAALAEIDAAFPKDID